MGREIFFKTKVGPGSKKVENHWFRHTRNVRVPLFAASVSNILYTINWT